jgi:DNA-binding helix-hairpin-helix protein with protein kinase domain
MTKSSRLVDSSGRPIVVGARLGSGGEGDVYELQAPARELVAKIYHHPLTEDKEDKLRAMAAGCDENLKKIAAWPIATLHLRPQGPICGFLMPKVSNYEPIHKLYGPAHRKQLFPKADWEFIINVARNVAAAFGTIHSHGHVIGDVNERNLFIATNTVVKLIDCDSFQITSHGRTHLCEVGTSHFTPPELQNIKSFRARLRTTNHDNFGLATLCFHILFMGRHPFSGVYAGREDMTIEKAIASSRFAFGKTATLKGMAPPPNCVTMEIVPSPISNLFERAFCEPSLSVRPLSSEWIGALDYLSHNLRTCSHNSVHKFFGGLAECPWCKVERQSGLIFFLGVFTSRGSQTHFDLRSVWQRILSISSPGECPVIDPAQFSTTPTPLPKEIQAAITLVKFKILAKNISAIVVLVGTLAIYPQAFLFALIVATVIYSCSVTNEPLRRERAARQAVLQEAERVWNYTMRLWADQAGDHAYKGKLSELERFKREYEGLGPEYEREKTKLHQTIREHQLQKFLNTHFIADHTISNIGPGRKAALVSFGIETAADIEHHRIRTIKGFGPALTNDLLQWRKNLESRFVFDASKGIDPSDIRALDQKFSQRRQAIENALTAGPESLTKSRAEILRKREALRSQVESAARSLAQARSNLAVFH